jgi:hypothetical protein
VVACLTPARADSALRNAVFRRRNKQRKHWHPLFDMTTDLSAGIEKLDKAIHSLQQTRQAFIMSVDTNIENLKRTRANAVATMLESHEGAGEEDTQHASHSKKPRCSRVKEPPPVALTMQIVPKGAHVVPIDVESISTECIIKDVYPVYHVADAMSGGELYTEFLRGHEFSFVAPKQISTPGQCVVYAPDAPLDSSPNGKPLKLGHVTGLTARDSSGGGSRVIVRDPETNDNVAVPSAHSCLVDMAWGHVCD